MCYGKWGMQQVRLHASLELESAYVLESDQRVFVVVENEDVL